MKKFVNLTSVIAIGWSLFQLYTASFGSFTSMTQRAIHVAFALALTFCLMKQGEKETGKLIKYFNWLLAMVSLGIGAYIAVSAERLTSRIPYVDEMTSTDWILGVVLIVLLLEASRRTVGAAMTILALIFIAYGLWGQNMPGLLQHRGMSFEDMVNLQFLSIDGIFGAPVGVSVDFVFYFILFGAFLEVSGGGKLFIDIAHSVTRKLVGGSAKAAVVASSLMGTISGSAAANVASVGIFTIPLMRRTGFSAKFAATVESLASTGGQILPPIMGAAAFIMADMLGIPYAAICLAALIPAVLYYVAIYITVDLKAKKEGLGTAEEVEEFAEKKEKISKRLHLLIPLLVLVVFIFLGFTLQKAAFWSIIAIILVSWLRRDTRMTLIQLFEALASGAKQSIQVAIPCAVAGVIVGVIVYTGLGLKFTSLIIQFSFGNFVISLLLISLACIILGMGMPTTSAYIMAAVLMAPALQEFGVEKLTAHMFVFYLACLSMITPPVALATYSAAGIAGTKPFQTGLYAFYYAIPLLLIPFAFIMSPELLMMGEWYEIVMITAFTCVGIYSLCVGVVGFLFEKTSMVVRLGFYAASICLIVPEITSSIIGLIAFIALSFLQKFRFKQQRAQTKMIA
ncbi:MULTISPECIES: TRAP transporter permease [unclassified Paenibacillus]|uniref:TRAP transporter permease n=1 Tax=unclassified Paenibacillus TaxID=185978 RepID=UPI001AEAD340|nr:MULTISPECIES: TRAP transporter permease [unclassified Paenibacillus]MBP1157253.1 TRAP transporter 4TM/12TM fusion protein [Paenibacillus sp. PvP091]MBP1172008.1 TRAP transporter 4TM/12TM fusion protein [Paenibacillus sp. PvR098]MBP2438389.1 TRAP transporter 4TM/12TM fusion protein [Paenibacillus sp. PvP052]